MTITLSKKAEEQLSRYPAEERQAFLERAIDGELKMEHIFGNDAEESTLVREARQVALEIRERSRDEDFEELGEILEELNS